ncbi:hypothetical protein TI03_01365 [Achromatium sp. WMS1]|nr:hypothetical protein TI03_01365 [Achromatium sp. WMS1]
MNILKLSINTLKNIAFTAVTFIAFLVLLEMLFRGVEFFFKAPEIESAAIIYDSKLGWVHNTQMKQEVRNNKCGERVVRHPATHRLINKFPKYPGNKKILFLGDSFTHAHEVSTGRAYYDVFEENVKDEYSVYAAGVSGFGNVQEYIALVSVFPEIKPDIVVWQLCGNDIINNVYELEKASLYDNNQRLRPYFNLETNQIEIKDPSFWLFTWSHGFKFVFHRLLILDWKYKLGLSDLWATTITLEPKVHDKYTKQGLEIFDRLLSDAITKFPNTKFYGFAVSSLSDDREYERIFMKYGMIYFSRFSQYVDSIANTNCAPLDLHWNHLGNQIAGDMLSKLLENN